MKRRLLVAALVLLATSAAANPGRKQSTTTNPVQFLMVSSTDHLTPATGLTVSVTCSKNGGSFAACSGAVSEVGNGVYSFAGNATDRDTLGELVIRATAAGADASYKTIDILRYDPFDDLQTSRFDNLDNSITDPQDQADVILATLLDGGAGESVDAALQRLAGVSTHSAADVWAAGTRTLTSFGSLTTDTATAVWASGTRSLTDKAGFGLSSAALDSIWDEPSPHNTASTMGALLTAAGAAGDPWSTAVPGAYAAGTAGYYLGLLDDIEADTSSLGGTAVTVTSPVINAGTLELYAGDAYDQDHSRAIDDFALTSAPSLTGATVTLVIDDVLSVTATSVTGAGGATQTPIFELTAAQTALLTRRGATAYRFQIQASWAADTPAQPAVLAAGVVSVKDRAAP